MRFAAPLLPATLVRRYKRFLADVVLPSGETVTVHCANPGAMTGLNMPGARVWLSRSEKASRKLPHSWELIEVDLGAGVELVGINTGHPNALAGEAIAAGMIPELAGYALMSLVNPRTRHKRSPPKTREKLFCDDRATVGASPETSVINLLFAGSRMSVLRLGLSRSVIGRRFCDRPQA